MLERLVGEPVALEPDGEQVTAECDRPRGHEAGALQHQSAGVIALLRREEGSAERRQQAVDGGEPARATVST